MKGVIFDLDGVLVSSDEFHYRGWARSGEQKLAINDLTAASYIYNLK